MPPTRSGRSGGGKGSGHDPRCAERWRLRKLLDAGNPPELTPALLYSIALAIEGCCAHTRLKCFRLACGWPVDETVARIHQLCADEKLPAVGLTRRSWVGWEAGDAVRRDYQDLVCRLFRSGPVQLDFATDYTPAPGEAAGETSQPDTAGPAPRDRVSLVSPGPPSPTAAPTTGGAVLSVPTRVVQALDVVVSGDADTLGIAADSLNELVAHYSETLSVSSPMSMYDDLLNVRSYAGKLLEAPGSALGSSRRRTDILVAAGWLSNLLAVATSHMGDQGAALVWCVDAERRSHESGHPDLAGWAALTRAMIAYYQGQARRSIELAIRGQGTSSAGTVAHAKLVAQEMRARAMLGDADGMTQARNRATRAIARLPSNIATSGVFSIALSEDPPYTATSLLLVKRFQEAVSVANSVIETVYSADARSRRERSSNYARTLLILGLAEAGLGRVGEAVAAGRAALGSAGLVWPTLVLAGKLDQVLTRDSRDAAETADYHALYLEAANRASCGHPQLVSGRPEEIE